MKINTYLLFFIFIYSTSYSQIGYQLDFTRHSIIQKTTPNGLIPKADIKAFGAMFGSQYWFRLKNYRLEFLPGAHIGAFANNNAEFKNYKIRDIFFQMDLPVLMYPLKFKEDCNCPTFKKDGNIMEKGFHLIGLAGFSLNFRNTNHDSVSIQKTTFSPLIGGGAGLDIGINKTLTLSPFILYTLYFADYISRTGFDKIDISRSSINLGLRLKIYKTKTRY